MALQISEIKQAAKRILADYDAGRANEIFAEKGTEWLTIEEAYAVQRAIAEFRMQRGEQCIGYKVGTLSPTIQRQFGLREPVHGYVWRDEMLASGSRLSCDPFDLAGRRFVNLAIEGEIALRMARGISPAISDDNFSASIEGWFPVIELHNYVFRGPSPTSQELIAGNAMHAGFVGAPASVLPLSELAIQTEIKIEVNGKIVESKRVSQIPRGPIGSVRWLSSSLQRQRKALKAYDIILTGSPGRLIPMLASGVIVVSFQNQRVELIVERLGEVCAL